MLIFFCCGCFSLDKSFDFIGVDVVDSMKSVDSRNKKDVFGSSMRSSSGAFVNMYENGSSTVGLVENRFKVELLDSMPIYDFFLALLGFVSIDLVMDSSVEMNVSCNFNSELSRSEIIDIVSLICSSVGLDCVFIGNVCTVSKQAPGSIFGKSVLVHHNKFIKNSQIFQDAIKTFEGVVVFVNGLITIVVANALDIELIKNILVSLDRDIFDGYVYKFFVCNDSVNFIERMKSILLGVNSRYEEQIQLFKVTANVVMVLSVSSDYLKNVETLSSLIDGYVNQDLQAYSVNVRYRNIDDVVNYVKGVMGEISISADR